MLQLLLLLQEGAHCAVAAATVTVIVHDVIGVVSSGSNDVIIVVEVVEVVSVEIVAVESFLLALLGCRHLGRVTFTPLGASVLKPHLGHMQRQLVSSCPIQ